MRRFATNGFDGCGGDDSVVCAAGLKALTLGAGGGFDVGAIGGLGIELRDGSGSDWYDKSRSAPVFIPPRLFNFGIPPAKSPPNWGAADAPFEAPPPPLLSLLLLALFGMDGSELPGGLRPPGGADTLASIGPDEDPPAFPTTGADLSFVTAFFNFVPFVISPRSAPYPKSQPPRCDPGRNMPRVIS